MSMCPLHFDTAYVQTKHFDLTKVKGVKRSGDHRKHQEPRITKTNFIPTSPVAVEISGPSQNQLVDQKNEQMPHHHSQGRRTHMQS